MKLLKVAVIGLICGLSGCRSASNPLVRTESAEHTPAADQAPISNTDPCAGKMHDISGAFLMYLLRYNDLPETLSQLMPYAQPMGVTDFTCPVSGLPYVYQRDGILFPEQNARVILYDPKPSHSNYRWAIILGAPTPDQPPRTKVIALPERFFLLRPSIEP